MERQFAHLPHTVVQQSKVGDRCVVAVSGELDLTCVQRLDETIADAFRSAPCVVIDLSECTYLDSSILRTLLKTKERLGDHMRIVVPEGRQIRRVMRISGAEQLLDLQETLEAALD